MKEKIKNIIIAAFLLIIVWLVLLLHDRDNVIFKKQKVINSQEILIENLIGGYKMDTIINKDE